jgi:hypothetical protein
LQTTDWIAASSLIVALAALIVAGFAIYRGNRNTSAATVVGLNEAFRQAWERFLPATGTNRRHQLSELMNLLEIASAIHLEGSLAGVSDDLVKDYLNSVLRLLIGDSYSESEIPTLLEDPKTFIYIKKFMNRRSELSVTIPTKWYESYK